MIYAITSGPCPSVRGPGFVEADSRTIGTVGTNNYGVWGRSRVPSGSKYPVHVSSCTIVHMQHDSFGVYIDVNQSAGVIELKAE
ncbi:Cytochrome b-c1 complex subunit 6 [Fusarium oxysporum f. sp. albedinis]|nr:Cytochrome b-c1 complex subunit 6 [Fusarium oxysporum f. sp. albedinis]